MLVEDWGGSHMAHPEGPVGTEPAWTVRNWQVAKVCRAIPPPHSLPALPQDSSAICSPFQNMRLCQGPGNRAQIGLRCRMRDECPSWSGHRLLAP